MHVALTTDAIEQYGRLPRSIQPRIDHVILRLAEWPNISGVKPLVGGLAGSFRIRTGDYRIVFRVSGVKSSSGKLAIGKMYILISGRQLRKEAP